MEHGLWWAFPPGGINFDRGFRRERYGGPGLSGLRGAGTMGRGPRGWKNLREQEKFMVLVGLLGKFWIRQAK